MAAAKRLTFKEKMSKFETIAASSELSSTATVGRKDRSSQPCGEFREEGERAYATQRGLSVDATDDMKQIQGETTQHQPATKELFTEFKCSDDFVTPSPESPQVTRMQKTYKERPHTSVPASNRQSTQDQMNRGTTDLFLTHNWGNDQYGRDNHARVKMVNEVLKERGYNTWFDDDQMSGDIQSQMADGIDGTKAVIVFITDRYRSKVNGDNENDNCLMEFRYASAQKPIIPVVLETDMKNSSEWKGLLGMRLGAHLFLNMSKDFTTSYVEEKVDELMEIIRKRIGEVRSSKLSEMSSLNVISGDAQGKEGTDVTFDQEGGVMSIVIKNVIASRLVNFEVQPCDTVGVVKMKIQEKEGIRQEQQMLTFGRMVLEDSKILSYYNIQNRSIVDLAVVYGISIRRKKRGERRPLVDKPLEDS